MFNCSPLKTPIAVLLCLFGLAASVAAAEYRSSVRPVIAKYCFGCHGEDKQKADLRMDRLSPDLRKGNDAETWHDVLDQLNLGEMPPPKAKQPTPAERAVIVDWVTKELSATASSKRFAAGRVKMRRLTRYEYRNTMRDLLGVNRDFAKELPPEPMSPDGFLNNAATLEMSPTQIETYLAAARRALEIAIVAGDRPGGHSYLRTNTAIARLPTKKVAGHLPVNPEFALDVAKYPRRGPFHMRVTARAAIPDGVGFPRIRITLGHVPGIVHVPHKLIAEIELTSDQPQTFEFDGWMEDYPQAGDIPFGNSGITGMILMLDYLEADGKELRYPDRRYVRAPAKPKKGQKPKPKPTPPPFGSRLEIAVDSLEFETPHHESWPPESHRRLIGKKPELTSETGHARRQLKAFIQLAFRRPARPPEIEQFGMIFDQIRAVSDSFEAAMREVYAAVLISPHFLYVVETRHPDAKDSQALSDFELASRLSYFLWSTMPDQRLFKLASQGRLGEPAVLQREVTRMLADQRSDQLAEHFAEQWFDLGALDRVAVNPEFYPDFDNDLKADMRAETTGFFRHLLRNQQSCLDLIDSDWTMLNRALARHYGLTPLPRSSQIVRTSLPAGSRRGGVLGQGSFLVSQSSGEFAHPIKRAVWILDRLLDSAPPPPPPDVPNLDSESPDLVGLTVKEQLALHRNREACANCHRGIDPWGLPLEHFDAVGRWRENIPVRLGKKKTKPVKPTPVDSATELPNGTSIKTAAALKHHLKTERREWFARAMVKRLLGYALGRSLDLGDLQTVEKLTKQFIASDFQLQQLILTLTKTEAFLTK
jgi:mono/diheme cytochrome c family protein